MIFADQRGRLRSFALTAMRMAFGEGLDLGEVAAVRAVAQRSGLAGDDVVEAISDPRVKAALRAANDPSSRGWSLWGPHRPRRHQAVLGR
jgi:2-hydroxychromene-2-carboxylate isomerase